MDYPRALFRKSTGESSVKDNLHVKLPLKEQVQSEGSFTSRLNMYLETREGFLSLYDLRFSQR
jgi:hypothetical protein